LRSVRSHRARPSGCELWRWAAWLQNEGDRVRDCSLEERRVLAGTSELLLIENRLTWEWSWLGRLLAELPRQRSRLEIWYRFCRQTIHRSGVCLALQSVAAGIYQSLGLF